MPFTTKDIGGGIQQLAYTADSAAGGNSAVDQTKDLLGLVELGQRIELGAQDKQLRDHQIKMLPLAKAKAQAELEASQIGVKKAQTEQLSNAYTSMINAYRIAPALGDQIAIQNGMTPGVPSRDGSVALSIPGSNGRTHTFSIFPGKETDPSKIATNANSLRDEWTEGSKGYVVVDNAWKTGQKFATYKTGAGDAGLISSAARSLNPTEAQNKGDIDLVNQSNLGNYLVGLYNKNKDGDAPFLTNQERTNLLELIKTKHSVTKDATIALGRAYGTMASNPALGIQRREDVLIPRGSLTAKEIFPEEYPEMKIGPAAPGEDAAMHLTDQPAETRKQPPVEAGFSGGTKSEAPVRKRKEPRHSVNEAGLDQLLGEGLSDFSKGNR